MQHTENAFMHMYIDYTIIGCYITLQNLKCCYNSFVVISISLLGPFNYIVIRIINHCRHVFYMTAVMLLIIVMFQIRN